jgi:hypothetical protein
MKIYTKEANRDEKPLAIEQWRRLQNDSMLLLEGGGALRRGAFFIERFSKGGSTRSEKDYYFLTLMLLSR